MAAAPAIPASVEAHRIGASDKDIVQLVGRYKKRLVPRSMRPGSPLTWFGTVVIVLELQENQECDLDSMVKANGFDQKARTVQVQLQFTRDEDEATQLEGKTVCVTGRLLSSSESLIEAGIYDAEVASMLPIPMLLDITHIECAINIKSAEKQ